MSAASRRDLRVLSAVLAGLLVLGLVAWFVWLSPGAQSRRELTEARDLWESQEPASYSFDYFHCGGMCAFCPVHVTVADGAVVDAVRSGEGCTEGPVDDAPTIEDVFATADAHRPSLLDRSSSVSYDDVWGFPESISFTCPPDTTDCGGGWTVSHFEVID